MKMGFLASAAALAVAGVAANASAGFSGFKVVVSNDGTNNTFDVYANFSEFNVLLNVFNVASSGDLGWGAFIHSDFAGGSWAPQFSSNPAADSFVLIGGQANFGNSTSADPNWGDPGFNQQSIPDGAGWFNSNPPNLQGQTNAEFKVWVARFVVSRDNLTTRSFTAEVGFNQGLGTPTVFGEGGFTIGIPGPGAVALLGLAGLAGRRRRA